MKFTVVAALLAGLAAFSVAEQSQKQYIISYPENTPASVLEDAKNAIVQAGGVIEHEYSLIKGFVVKASAQVLETVQAMGSGSDILIEEDQTVHVNQS